MIFDKLVEAISSRAAEYYSAPIKNCNQQSKILPDFDVIQQEFLDELENENNLSLQSFTEVIEEYEDDLGPSELRSIEELADFLEYTEKSIFENIKVTDSDLERYDISIDEVNDWQLNYRIIEEVEIEGSNNWGRTIGDSRYEIVEDSLNTESSFWIVEPSRYHKDERVNHFFNVSKVKPADHLMQEDILEE